MRRFFSKAGVQKQVIQVEENIMGNPLDKILLNNSKMHLAYNLKFNVNKSMVYGKENSRIDESVSVVENLLLKASTLLYKFITVFHIRRNYLDEMHIRSHYISAISFEDHQVLKKHAYSINFVSNKFFSYINVHPKPDWIKQKFLFKHLKLFFLARYIKAGRGIRSPVQLSTLRNYYLFKISLLMHPQLENDVSYNTFDFFTASRRVKYHTQRKLYKVLKKSRFFNLLTRSSYIKDNYSKDF
jgi:hypothetical protein